MTTALQEIRSRGEESFEGVRAGQWSKAATAVVAAALMSLGLKRRSLGGTVVALAGGALLYRGLQGRTARREGAGERARRGHFIEVEHSLTVGRPAEALYRLWREPSTLSHLMAGFADVTPTEGDGRHWELHELLGRRLRFDSRVVEDRPAELIRWESTEDSAVRLRGWVRFRPTPADLDTEVTLHVGFLPPGGALVEALAQRLRAIPTQRVMTALRRFKTLAETGEAPTLGRDPSDRVNAD
ncbi:SRPBCC family protein [Corallococcus sp. RDP092CA]|uniref:SRPBCC family protein n=1 Tax=Corallococcus sp. RDP092CA TaxID=3109369 RepID=UPI0035B0CE3C